MVATAVRGMGGALSVSRSGESCAYHSEVVRSSTRAAIDSSRLQRTRFDSWRFWRGRRGGGGYQGTGGNSSGSSCIKFSQLPQRAHFFCWCSTVELSPSFDEAQTGSHCVPPVHQTPAPHPPFSACRSNPRPACPRTPVPRHPYFFPKGKMPETAGHHGYGTWWSGIPWPCVTFPTSVVVIHFTVLGRSTRGVRVVRDVPHRAHRRTATPVVLRRRVPLEVPLGAGLFCAGHNTCPRATDCQGQRPGAGVGGTLRA